MLIYKVDDFLIDQSQHHFHHIHRFGIGHAHSLDKRALLAHPFQHIVDLWPAAVNDYRVHSHELQQHDVAGEALFEMLLDHGITAIFNDNRFTVKTSNIRQGLGQNFSFIFCSSLGR